MISTDRLLWLLQMILFLAAAGFIALTIYYVFIMPSASPQACTWTFTLPDGQQMTAEWNECGQEYQSAFTYSVLLSALYLMWFLSLGAIIFCLRRIANYLR